MKFLFIFFVIFCTSSSFADWIQQNSQTTEAINSLSFINSRTGYAAGSNGAIRKTENGGDNWDVVQSPFPANFIYVKMFNENEIVLVSLTDNKVLRTSNGGINWSSSDITISSVYVRKKVQFTDLTTGFLVAGGTLFKSTDYGVSWVPKTSPTSIKDISMINENIGWICGTTTVPFPPPSGTAYARVLKTTNGGSNWDLQVDIQENSFSIYRIFAVTSSLGLYNGFHSKSLSRTTDGYLWTAPVDGAGAFKNYHYYSFPDTRNGWVIGDFILKTTNSGANWGTVSTPYGNVFNAVHFADSNTGWFAGAGGKIIKTTGGVTNINIVSNSAPEMFKLQQNYPNPFNPVTNINFLIPASGNVTMKVFDMLGKEVKVLVNGIYGQGSYNVTFDGGNLNSGMYFYTINFTNDEGRSFTDTKKLMLVK